MYCLAVVFATAPASDGAELSCGIVRSSSFSLQYVVQPSGCRNFRAFSVLLLQGKS